MSDWSTVATAAITSVPAIIAAVAALRANTHAKNVKHSVNRVENKANENKEALTRVEHATNGVLGNRIREVVRDELIRSSGNTEEMRALLDTVLGRVQAGDADDI